MGQHACDTNGPKTERRPDEFGSCLAADPGSASGTTDLWLGGMPACAYVIETGSAGLIAPEWYVPNWFDGRKRQIVRLNAGGDREIGGF